MEIIKSFFRGLFWLLMVVFLFGTYIGSEVSECVNFNKLYELDSKMAYDVYPNIHKNLLKRIAGNNDF